GRARPLRPAAQGGRRLRGPGVRGLPPRSRGRGTVGARTLRSRAPAPPALPARPRAQLRVGEPAAGGHRARQCLLGTSQDRGRAERCRPGRDLGHREPRYLCRLSADSGSRGRAAPHRGHRAHDRHRRHRRARGGLLRRDHARAGPARMTLSVVIPALDEAPNLARLLPDVIHACPGAEVIVVDGGSRDGTAAVVTGLAGVRLLEGARGRARQMNAGARESGGDVLLFLHADTRLPDGAAGAIARAVAAPGVVGGRFDVRFDSRRRVLRIVAWFMNARSRATSICTGDQAIFVRRADFNAVGGYPDIPLMEDIELCRRLKGRGRLAALRDRVTTSARKWEREGPLRTIGLMLALRLLHFCGVAPARLHRWYYGAPKESHHP